MGDVDTAGGEMQIEEIVESDWLESGNADNRGKLIFIEICNFIGIHP